MVIGKAPGGGDLVVGAVRILEFTIAAVVPFYPCTAMFPKTTIRETTQYR